MEISKVCRTAGEIRYANGMVDRKRECDKLLREIVGDKGIVLRSSVIGKHYVASVSVGEEVFAVTANTKVDKSREDCFMAEFLDETKEGTAPILPAMILRDLTPTTNPNALLWRAKGQRYVEKIRRKRRERHGLDKYSRYTLPTERLD